MSKTYKDINVYEASIERIDYIFKHFERVYVSFSGGKDSGVMLNLVLEYMKKHNITKKIGLMIMDNEANYEDSIDFMVEIIDKNIEYLDVYWCALPITLPASVSSFATEWQCFGEKDKDKWIRPYPDRDYVVTFDNHKFPFFKENMTYDKFWDEFGRWYAGGELTACLIGIRTDESLNRYRAIVNKNKTMFNKKQWTTHKIENCFNCYPIYDFTTEDIWIINGKKEWDYNKLYDKFYLAGLTISQMRVASPFMSEAKSSLALYKVIDPDAWSKLFCRIQGANFVATYGKQLDYKKVKLPDGYNWKSFTKFLLSTLPPETAREYKRKFVQSLKFWGRTGRGIPDNIIKELEALNIKFYKNGLTPHGRKNKERIIFKKIPDNVDKLSSSHKDVASWKRLAITILRNDHTCKYLGLTQTQEQIKRQREIMEKYKNI